METITVNVYTNNYESKNYLCSFKMNKYKQLARIKEKLREFIQQEEDEKHKKIRFYCFDLYHYQMKLSESELYYKPKN